MCVCVCVCVCVRACVCVHARACSQKFAVTVFWFFVMGYALQFGEKAHKRVYYYLFIYLACLPSPLRERVSK